MKKTVIVVPMKDPAASKTRLAGALDGPARARLASLLFSRTLDFLAEVACETGAACAVVTSSDTAKGMAEAAGFTVIDEPANSTLNGAARRAARWAEGQGYARLCLIPADLAAPRRADVLALLASEADVTVCPSADRGTNALLLAPPTAIKFHFGPRSAARHMKAAQGLDARLMPLDSLSFDIDTTDCLARAQRLVPELSA
ncbi:MAG: 2-phospho-L-lactate guanylyltransferase [Pseudomonadota bacterium]